MYQEQQLQTQMRQWWLRAPPCEIGAEVQVCKYIRKHTSKDTSIHTIICIYIYIYTYIHISLSMYIYIYIWLLFLWHV